MVCAMPIQRSAAPKTREEALRDFRTGQILAAARGVIGQTGYADASIDRIAEAAGVARSTVYVYFDGKEDLLNQCLAENRIELSDRVRESVERAQGLEGRLEAFLTAILAYVGDYQDFFRAIMRVRGLDPFFQEGERAAPELDVIRVEVQGVIADIFKQGELDGILTPASSLEAARVIGALIYGALMWRANDTDPIPPEQEARILVQTLLYGLTRPR
jgi:AcrR family transcriptional regulator